MVLAMTLTTNSDLRRRRQATGVSQEKLARRADCSLNTVRLAEGGFTGISPRMWARLMGALEGLEAERASPEEVA
jgi:predicted transcriptional regulator